MEAKSQEQISTWILEFLLRNPSLESVAKKSLAVLPLPAGDHRLGKIVLLRTVECEASDGLVTESTLEALELIHDLDSRRGFPAGDAIRAAYAAVMSELAVRRLLGDGGRAGPGYHAAMKRIWRARLEGGSEESAAAATASGLLGGELRRRWDELEAAIWDEGACERLMRLNTRNDAVLAVKAYLKEAWVLVGKLFVGLGVRLRDEEGRGIRVSREEDEPPDKGTSLTGLAELMKKVDSEGLDGRDVCDKGVALPGSAGLAVDDTPLSNGKELHRGKAVLRSKHVAILHKRPRGPVRISDVEVSDMDISNQKYDLLPTPEVNRVQEALKSSSLELKKAVTDPLPEALQAAETIVSELATKNVIRDSHLENQSVREADADNIPADRSGEPVQSSDANLDIPSCSHQNDVLQPNVNNANPEKPSCSHKDDVIQPNTSDANPNKPSCSRKDDVIQPNTSDANPNKPSCSRTDDVIQPNTSDANPDKPSCCRKDDVPRPNLMERNGTARTFEWDDSIDDTPEVNVNGKSRLHLPSPKKRLVSPLKKYEPTKLSKRRRNKRWTLLEEDTLRTGVQKFCRGNWKLILSDYRDVFEERTEVDLKDKWRNMMK